MNLRPYQYDLVTQTAQAFRDNQRVILCAPTGSGKTVMFSEIVRRSAEKFTQVLVLTDRIELFKQTFSALSVRGIPVQTISADNDHRNFNPNALVTVGMVETVKRRFLFGYKPQLIICDEAHKGNFTKVLAEIFPDVKVIGATATPIGKHLPKLYTKIVQTVDIPELIRDGFLSPCRAFQMQDDFSDLDVKAGEYTEASQFGHFNKRHLYAGVVQEYQTKTPGKKCIVFNVNIEHAIEMTAQFRSAGIVSECITSRTPKEERNRILKAFSDGLFPVLNNCGILTTGYDEPSIEVVIMNRKTKSLPLWLQCCGRGSRILPGKTHFTVLDFGMNHDEHGLWAEPRTWSLIEKKKRKKGVDASPVKNCPGCSAMLSAKARKCEYCGHEFELPEAELREGVMKELTPPELIGKQINDLSPNELYDLQKSGRFATKFIWRIARSRNEEFLKQYAKLAGYHRGWCMRQMKMEKSDINFTVR